MTHIIPGCASRVQRHAAASRVQRYATALIAKSIKKEELLCYEDLGTEAIRRYTVEDFPCIVAIDCEGGNVYDHNQ